MSWCGRLSGFVIVLLAALAPTLSRAHESQPGLLELNQLTDTRYEVVWRAPIYYGRPHPARVQLPELWQAVAEPSRRQLPDSEVFRQVVEVPAGTRWCVRRSFPDHGRNHRRLGSRS